MKLSEIITKYEPLGWKFDYKSGSIEGYWTFQSSRMERPRGFKEHAFNNSDATTYEIDEDGMLDSESLVFAYEK